MLFIFIHFTDSDPDKVAPLNRATFCGACRDILFCYVKLIAEFYRDCVARFSRHFRHRLGL